MASKGRIATAQDKALDRVRAARKDLVRAERALVEGKFRTAQSLIESAQEAAKSGVIHAGRAYDGMVEAQRPTL